MKNKINILIILMLIASIAQTNAMFNALINSGKQMVWATDYQKELVKAIEADNFKRIKELIDSGVDLNYVLTKKIEEFNKEYKDIYLYDNDILNNLKQNEEFKNLIKVINFLIKKINDQKKSRLDYTDQYETIQLLLDSTEPQGGHHRKKIKTNDYNYDEELELAKILSQTLIKNEYKDNMDVEEKKSNAYNNFIGKYDEFSKFVESLNPIKVEEWQEEQLKKITQSIVNIMEKNIIDEKEKKDAYELFQGVYSNISDQSPIVKVIDKVIAESHLSKTKSQKQTVKKLEQEVDLLDEKTLKLNLENEKLEKDSKNLEEYNQNLESEINQLEKTSNDLNSALAIKQNLQKLGGTNSQEDEQKRSEILNQEKSQLEKEIAELENQIKELTKKPVTKKMFGAKK